MDPKSEPKFSDGGGSNYIGYFGIFSSFISGNINDFVSYNVVLISCDINLIDLRYDTLIYLVIQCLCIICIIYNICNINFLNFIWYGMNYVIQY